MAARATRDFFPCWCFMVFLVFFPCWCFMVFLVFFPAGASWSSFCAGASWSSFPVGASHGLLSLLVLLMVFFPCRCFIWSSFPAGASYGLLSLQGLLMVFFPCWCFLWSSFPSSLTTQISYIKVLPWQPNKMATFNRHLAEHDTVSSQAILSTSE